MNQTIAAPDYLEISDALAKTGTTISAAEAHGIMCGIICSVPRDNDPLWIKLLSGPKKHLQSQNALQQLHTYSETVISKFELEFTLVLPGDEADINERTECLGLWCQGFLVGLQQGDLTLPADAHSDAAGALRDLSEIAQVTHGGQDNGNEEDEAAYVELVEYVRLAVLMLYQELRTPSVGKQN